MGQHAQPKATKEKERRIVLNASVSLLWFLRDEPPELCERADWLYDDIMSGRVTVHVPDIWLFEVSGGLVKAVHSKRLTITQAQAALSMVDALVALPNWHTHSHNRDWLYSDVARWAMGYSVSFTTPFIFSLPFTNEPLSGRLTKGFTGSWSKPNGG